MGYKHAKWFCSSYKTFSLTAIFWKKKSCMEWFLLHRTEKPGEARGIRLGQNHLTTSNPYDPHYHLPARFEDPFYLTRPNIQYQVSAIKGAVESMWASLFCKDCSSKTWQNIDIDIDIEVWIEKLTLTLALMRRLKKYWHWHWYWIGLKGKHWYRNWHC